MSLEYISGLIGGFFGPIFGKILGKFRLWKIFLASMFFIYLGLFAMGLVVVGFKATVSRFGEFFTPFALLVFVGLSATVTLVAFLGRTAQKNKEN
ncbi:TPA: hypothetical protein QDB11_005596 [Burkholderia vietnamiensis]|jgi:hypothetical protein|uniref:hypothetical protein n=1 Tax=Burkholderia vietnamiensis TaxID=60552 RepID=UPI00265510A4|nr:hypothetical protein [Burkholderia vietnamiensis]MDN8114908.1 hypothetical protein [Burkholderia vietnamiensis]HDR9140865.1 hypothetical protein [Burkholderia vietnamiensis]